MVMRETVKVLFQVYSDILDGLEKPLSHAQDLVEKSNLIKDLKIKFPFSSSSYTLADIILMYRELLKSSSDTAQQISNDLQSIKFTEILSEFQSLLQSFFTEIEEEIKHLKKITFSYVINDIQQDISIFFNSCISEGFISLKENLYHNLGKFNEFVESKLQEASQELQLFHQYIKALREEYFDPSIIGWTVKYYELEEKLVNLFKTLAVALTDFHSTYTVSAAYFASQLSTQVEQFVHGDIQEYLSILADADGKGKEKIAELSTTAQEIIKSWATALKEIISDYHQQFRSKLQEFLDQLSDYHEKFIAESKRLIDLSIQSYSMFLRYITELLKKLQSATVSDVSPYIKLAPGELTITF
jgi:apolipoprotein B